MASVPWFCCLILLANLNVLLVHAQYGGPGMYPYGPSPYPVVIRSNDGDGMRNIWPILFLLLADNWGNGGGWGGGFGGFGAGGGGYGGGCGCGCNCGCNCCNNNIPIPYPIPIPTYNPIITC